jgi:hypothetical protein
MSTFSHLAAEHWVLGGIVVSLLWFAAGRQSLLNRNRHAALFLAGHRGHRRPDRMWLVDSGETVAGRYSRNSFGLI